MMERIEREFTEKRGDGGKKSKIGWKELEENKIKEGKIMVEWEERFFLDFLKEGRKGKHERKISLNERMRKEWTTCRKEEKGSRES